MVVIKRCIRNRFMTAQTGTSHCDRLDISVALPEINERLVNGGMNRGATV